MTLEERVHISNENKTKIMPEVNRKCFNNLRGDKLKMHIVDYLYRRSVNGHEHDYKHFTKKLFDSAKDLYKKDLTAHFGCVNAIEFSSDGNLLFSGGDDRRVLMWNVNDAMMYYTGKLGDGAKPFEMKRCHYSNIFCLAVDNDNKRILSGSNDDQVIVHDYATGNFVDVFIQDSPVFSLSLHPNNGNIFASAADNGRILIYDIRESNYDLLCVAKLETPFHGVMFNPCEPSLIATANSKLGVHLWDLRKPKEFLIKCTDDASMAVRWNQLGTLLLASRNLLPIVIYDPLVPKKKLEFDASTYFNACTMKSCSFAGDNDEYILSGSDDFNLYMWKIPEPWPESKWVGSEHLTLTGHRSIVNQVRYSPSKQLIATSGVEKIIKLWTPFPMPYSVGSQDTATTNRHRVLCSSRSCTRSPGFLSHDYSQESVEEDTKMIHFFDNLLRKELDDVTFHSLSQSCHLDTNLFSVPSKKKETRIYERLIRKKKRLSKILLEKTDENKSVCFLSKPGGGSTSTGRNKTEPPGDNRVPDTSKDDTSDTSIESDSPNSSERNTNCSPTFSSPSTASNAAADSPGNSSSDSHLCSEQFTSEVASSSDSSKTSFTMKFSDSEDSNESKSGTIKKLNNLKDSGINLSESSESEGSRSCAVFKKRRLGGSSRCYRNSSKWRRKKFTSTDTSGSESADGAKRSGKDGSSQGTSSQSALRTEAESSESDDDDDDDDEDCIEKSCL